MTRSIAAPASPTLSVSAIPVRQPGVLLVDDDRTTLSILSYTLSGYNYTIKTARSGEEALTLLEECAHDMDAIILDREMPGLNGIEVVGKLKADPKFAGIPVIMLTGSGKPEQIQEGIDAGVYYYLTKPVEDILLKSIVGAAIQERRYKDSLMGELLRHDTALRAMRTCQLSIRSITEAEDTASFLACCFPNPERVIGGLLELLVNAIEHGNLGISYEDKTQLLAHNRWREEIDQRLKLPEYANRAADVVYQRKDDAWVVQITDAGKGFDWKRYWQIDPSRATSTHGRGIARARLMAFDRISYNEAGNQVTALIQVSPKNTLDW